MTDRDFDIAISGGGLIGPALALALDGAGFRVCVIDRADMAARAAADFDGRAYAVAPASARLLGRIGVWQTVAPNAREIARIAVGEGAGSPELLHFDPALIGAARIGHIVEDRHLRGALLAALESRGIAHLAPATVAAAAFDGPRARLALEGGGTVAARLAVAADGRRSRLVSEAGITRIGWPYRQTGLVNAIEHARPHEGLAHQSFFPGGPFAVLPLTGNRSSIVWSEERRRAAALGRLDDAAFAAELRARIGGRLGTIRLAGPRWAYPLDLTLAAAYRAPRLALVGDAAHGVHPIAGQGMNLGLRDVAALAEVLTDAARIGEDIGAEAVLTRYQRWRRFDATAFSLGMDALNRLFSNDNGPLGLLRRAGLRAVGAVPGARPALMREAAGESGDIPRLLRGEAL